MYNLIKWHRGTPTVPSVGAVNVPRKSEKSRKFMFLKILGGGNFSLYIIQDFDDFRRKNTFSKYSKDFLQLTKNIFFIQNVFFDLVYLSSVTESHLEHPRVKSHRCIIQNTKICLLPLSQKNKTGQHFQILTSLGKIILIPLEHQYTGNPLSAEYTKNLKALFGLNTNIHQSLPCYLGFFQYVRITL